MAQHARHLPKHHDWGRQAQAQQEASSGGREQLCSQRVPALQASAVSSSTLIANPLTLMLHAWPCCWPMYISSRPLNGCTASRRRGAFRWQAEAKGRRASRRASSSRLDTWERCGV